MAGIKPVKYEYHGEMFSIKELSEMSGICETTLRHRIANGHSMNEAIDDHEALLKRAKENQLANLRNQGGRRKKEAYTNGSGYPDPTAGEAIMNNMAEYMNEPVEDTEEKDPRIINGRRVGADDIWYTKYGKQVYIRECYPEYCVCYDVIDPTAVMGASKKVITDVFPCIDLNLRADNIGIFYTRPKFMYYSALTDYRFTLTNSCVSDKDWEILHGKEQYHRLRGRMHELAKQVEDLTEKNKALVSDDAKDKQVEELKDKLTKLSDAYEASHERIDELEAANKSMGDELIRTKETCEDYERAIETLRGVNKALRAEIANAPTNKSDGVAELDPPMDVTVDKLRMELEITNRVYQEVFGWLFNTMN